jgi:hypothetical protein
LTIPRAGITTQRKGISEGPVLLSAPLQEPAQRLVRIEFGRESGASSPNIKATT